MPKTGPFQAEMPLAAGDVGEIARRLVANISEVLIGKEEQVRIVVVGLLARGHVLIEDIP